MVTKRNPSAASAPLMPPTAAERQYIAANTPTPRERQRQRQTERIMRKEAERMSARKLSRVSNVLSEPLADAYKAQQTLFPRYATRDLPKAHRDYLGLIVYDTTRKALLICNGTAWKPIINSQSPD